MNKVFFFLCFFAAISLKAQTDPEASTKTAKDNFTFGNFKGALDDYLLLIKTDSTNVTYNFRIGVCYLNTNIDKTKALPYLLKASADSKCDNKVFYELGRAYMFSYKFDDAIKTFKKYKEITSGNESFVISTDRQIEMCEEAKELIQKPVNVTIENIGPEINSAYPDFKPYVPKDESFLAFSSKRAGNTGNLLDYDGNLTSDVYFSFPKYEKWVKAKNAGGAINTDLVEETCGISADGSKLFIYCDSYAGYEDILVAEKKGKSYVKAASVGKNINTNKIESSAAITPDKKYLIFAADRNAANGGMDLFMSRKLPSGEWGIPENLGTDINTVYDEDYPYMAADGKTLYFCSQGHNSMGGFDIFKSTWNEKDNSWSEPENLGYPVNTPDDDLSICMSATGRHGFISSLRPGGYGDLDIYKVIFNSVEPAYTVVNGTLLNIDSVNIFQQKEIADTTKKVETAKIEVKSDSVNSALKKNISIHISVTDTDTQKIFGNYSPNKTTGRFAIVLPPGNFSITVEADGFQKYSETVKVYDKPANSELTKDIVLTPL
jgi:tetratricopeptide (TPR) repeat protein